MSDSIRWLALESNPDVLNKYISALGVPSSKWQFCDIFGTDPELLLMVPRPVHAVLLLYPLTDVTSAAEEEERKRIEKDGQFVSPKLWFMKQTIGNACGTIGVLHGLANKAEELDLVKDSPMMQFLATTKDKSAAERAEELIKRQDIAEAHTESANQGQTETPDLDARINLHFIAFVEKEGHLFELDGRKEQPINHGKTTTDTFLEDAVAVIDKCFMKRDPKEMNFSMMALASAQ